MTPTGSRRPIPRRRPIRATRSRRSSRKRSAAERRSVPPRRGMRRPAWVSPGSPPENPADPSKWDGRGFVRGATRSRRAGALAVFVMVAASLSASCRSAVKGGAGGTGGLDRPEEAAALAAAVHYTGLADSLLPGVAVLVGVPPGEPVDVVVKTRREMDAVLHDILEREYPGDELARRARCLGELGLLPRKFDLAGEVVSVAGEQMGALYDPYSKAIYAIRDLEPELDQGGMDRIIVAHELTHALQDRVADIPAQDPRCLADLDFEFALHAILEGMATVVMTANAGGRDLNTLPDLGSQ